jgi:SNF2 family DNA or RNA helicase
MVIQSLSRDPALNLYPFQQEARLFLLTNRRAILADEPGAGKTPPTLVAASNVDVPARRIAIVCPAVARIMWRRMAKIWYRDGWEDINIFSYDEYTRNVGARAEVDNCDLLILDEAHMLGSVTSKRTMYLLGPDGPVRHKKIVWALTGTLMQRNPSQLYPILRSFWPEVIKVKYQKWVDIFCTGYRKQINKRKFVHQITGGKNLDRLHALLFAEQSPVKVLRRTLEDVGMQLPPLVVEVLQHENPRAQDTTDWWDAVPDEVVQRRAFESGEYKMCGERKVVESVDAIIADMEAGYFQRPLVFAYHHSVIDKAALRFRASGLHTYVITGKTSDRDRQAIIDAFQIAKGSVVLLAQINTMETAVTLTNADRVEIIEGTWNASKDEQAVKRAYRLGQHQHLVVRYHVLADSVDEAMTARRARQLQDRAEIGI